VIDPIVLLQHRLRHFAAMEQPDALAEDCASFSGRFDELSFAVGMNIPAGSV